MNKTRYLHPNHFSWIKPISTIRPTRSSSILHSVEDLSTDSTCVYKARSGYDSNRGSRRRIITQKFGNRLSNDEIPDKQTLNSLFDQNTTSTIQASNNRGLSKSMILTPVSDLSEMDDNHELKRPKTLCEKIQRYIICKIRIYLIRVALIKCNNHQHFMLTLS